MSSLHYCILQLHKASMYTNVKNDNRTLQKTPEFADFCSISIMLI